MIRRMCKSKIHRATVTQADLQYEGSVTIDRNLMDMADLLPYEEVHVWNVTNGSRFVTYAIEGDRDSGVICVNGAAARLVAAGDLVIIASWADMNDQEAREHEPKVVFVDGANRPKEMRREVAGPRLVVSNG
jgi:aspartate 1-decarboxylase